MEIMNVNGTEEREKDLEMVNCVFLLFSHLYLFGSCAMRLFDFSLLPQMPSSLEILTVNGNKEGGGVVMDGCVTLRAPLLTHLFNVCCVLSFLSFLQLLVAA